VVIIWTVSLLLAPTNATVPEQIRIAVLAGGSLQPAHVDGHRIESFRALILTCQPRAAEGERASSGQCDLAATAFCRDYPVYVGILAPIPVSGPFMMDQPRGPVRPRGRPVDARPPGRA
jgi:hypothetical protein